MTQKQAIKNGYTFTGIYGHDKEEIKKKASELRKTNVYAIVVTKTYKGRCNCNTIGYSVYKKIKEK